MGIKATNQKQEIIAFEFTPLDEMGSDRVNDKRNEKCLLEDKQKQCSHSWVYKILHDHTAQNVCEKCHLVVGQ